MVKSKAARALSKKMWGKSSTHMILIGLLIVFVIFLILALMMRGDLLDHHHKKNAHSRYAEEGFLSGAPVDISYSLFYADWCPHCQTCKPEWQNMKKNWNKCSKVKMQEFNCENSKDQCKKYNIQGYPTIILTIGDKDHEFNGSQRNEAEMVRFLESKLDEHVPQWQSLQ